MKAILCVVLALAVAAQAGVLTTSHQIHDVALAAPVVHHAPIVHHAVAPAVLHTSSSTSYKYRAPAAKVLTAPLVHASPITHVSHALPLVHSSSVLVH